MLRCEMPEAVASPVSSLNSLDKCVTRMHSGDMSSIERFDDSTTPVQVEGQTGVWKCKIRGWGSPNGKGTFGGILLAQVQCIDGVFYTIRDKNLLSSSCVGGAMQ